MQILKKRNTTEPFNKQDTTGITNYESWIEDFYHKAPTHPLDNSIQTIYDNFSLNTEVQNPYNMEWTHRSQGIWNADPNKNTFTWIYNFTGNAPVSGMYIFNCSALHIWDVAIEKFWEISFRFITRSGSYPIHFQRDGTNYDNGLFRWSSCLMEKGDQIGSIMYFQRPIKEEDSINPPLSYDDLINGIDGVRTDALRIQILLRQFL